MIASKIMMWILQKGLKIRKVKALVETQADLLFLRTFKKHILSFDMSAGRKRYAELNGNDHRTEAENDEFGQLGKDISQAEGTKREVEQLVQLRLDLADYIKCL